MNSRTGEAVKEDTFKGLGTMTSVWETTKKVRIPHLEEEQIRAAVVTADSVGKVNMDGQATGLPLGWM